MLIGLLGTNFSEILIEIYTFSFKKMHLKMSSGKWRPCCLGLNVLNIKHEQWEYAISAPSYRYLYEGSPGDTCLIDPSLRNYAIIA